MGETTGGGANPGRVVRLTEHFGAFIPNGRAINPITKTNWEGVGVTTYVALLRDPKLFPDPNDRKYLDDVIAHSLKDPNSILTP